mmetsp:Transcript_2075/g.5037  ORF Transcript_2075/g.5037 Transcript_2075/m.5037 type:complete len:268 (-) Transcript_2075:112-915(-)
MYHRKVSTSSFLLELLTGKTEPNEDASKVADEPNYRLQKADNQSYTNVMKDVVGDMLQQNEDARLLQEDDAENLRMIATSGARSTTKTPSSVAKEKFDNSSALADAWKQQNNASEESLAALDKEAEDEKLNATENLRLLKLDQEKASLEQRLEASLKLGPPQVPSSTLWVLAVGSPASPPRAPMPAALLVSSVLPLAGPRALQAVLEAAAGLAFLASFGHGVSLSPPQATRPCDVRTLPSDALPGGPAAAGSPSRASCLAKPAGSFL